MAGATDGGGRKAARAPRLSAYFRSARIRLAVASHRCAGCGAVGRCRVQRTAGRIRYVKCELCGHNDKIVGG